MFTVQRCVFVACAVATFVVATAELLLRDWEARRALWLAEGWREEELGGPEWVAAIYAADLTWLVSGLISTRANRRIVARLLGRLAASSEASAAATVAELCGSHGTKKALALAKRRFRVLPFDAMSEADLSDAAANLATKQGDLFSKTCRADLGTCDAFVSHSWRDSKGTGGAEKYEALRLWATDFEAERA